jgi:hypothetical protein
VFVGGLVVADAVGEAGVALAAGSVEVGEAAGTVALGEGVGVSVDDGAGLGVAVALGPALAVGVGLSVGVLADVGVGDVADGVGLPVEVLAEVGVGVVAVGVGTVAVGVGVGVGAAGPKGFSVDHSGLDGEPAAERDPLLGAPGGLGGATNPAVSYRMSPAPSSKWKRASVLASRAKGDDGRAKLTFERTMFEKRSSSTQPTNPGAPPSTLSAPIAR